MSPTEQKLAVERAFLKWSRETLPAESKQFLTVFESGYIAGMRAAVKIMKEGVKDPYDWPTGTKGA